MRLSSTRILPHSFCRAYAWIFHDTPTGRFSISHLLTQFSLSFTLSLLMYLCCSSPPGKPIVLPSADFQIDKIDEFTYKDPVDNSLSEHQASFAPCLFLSEIPGVCGYPVFHCWRGAQTRTPDSFVFSSWNLLSSTSSFRFCASLALATL